MLVENVAFERVQDPPLGFERWKIRVMIRGGGFGQRAAPVAVAVGDQNVELIFPLLGDDGIEGIQGFLREVPQNGEEVSVGYVDSELFGTGFEFSESQL